MKILCIFLCWLLIAPLPLGVAQTKVDAPTQIKRLAYLDVRQFQNADGTLAHPNDPTACNDVAINAAIATLPTSGGIVLLPNGEWWTCATIYLPTSVWLLGVGWGQPSIYGTTQGTVISASSSFTTGYTGSAFSKNWMLAINGNGTRNANGSATGDTFDARAMNMSVNCNNVAGCGALYIGHANEQSGYSYITAQNFTLGGIYWCGAGMSPTYADSVCGAGTGGGSQGDGPDENLQFYPSTAMSSTTPIVMISGELDLKGFNNVTIAGQNSAAPTGYAGYIGGVSIHMENIHMEGINQGFVLGASTPYCPLLATCNGLKTSYFQNIDLTSGVNGTPPATSSAIDIVDSEGGHIGQAYGGGSSCGAIRYNYESFNQCTSANQIVGKFDTDLHVNVQSDDPTFSWYFYQPVLIENNPLLVSSPSNQLVLQRNTSPFQGEDFNVDATNSLTFTPSTGSGNLFLQSAFGVFGLIGVDNVLNGLDMQSLVAAPSESGIVATFCGDTYWDKVNLVWQIGNIGSNNYSCAFIPQGGGFAVSSGIVSQPTSISDATFLANTNFRVTPNGRTFIGTNSYSQADAGPTVQVLGNLSTTDFLTVGGVLNVTNPANLNGGATVTGALSATGLVTGNSGLAITAGGASITGELYVNANAQVTGNTSTAGLSTSAPITITQSTNTDNKGQLPITSSNNSATYTFSGTYTHEPVCVTSLDGGVVNGFSGPVLTLVGSNWQLYVHTNLNLTATANYICMVTP